MMATQIDPFSSAVVMLRALRARQISASELLDLHLRRIERYNPKLNAIVTPNYQEARRVAAGVDDTVAQDREGGRGRPPVQGLPITIKDCIYVKGLTTTGGVPARAQLIDEEDARVVARVRSAGAVIMGKTNVPPYASDFQSNNPVFGRSNNPWDLERTPGGSTGGGAAAVAAGLSPLEFGGDFMGSIRIPAAFCGIYGHKPSLTLLPQTGHFPGGLLPNPAAGVAVLGPLARSPEDLELALQVAAGPDVGEDAAWQVALPAPRHQRLAEFRIAVLPAVTWLPVDGEIVGALEELADKLRGAGAQVARVQPEAFGDLRNYYKLYLRIVAAIENTGLPEQQRNRRAEFSHGSGDEFLAAYADGIEGTSSDYIAWYAEREQCRASYRDFFRRWDVLLAPVNIVNAFPHTDLRFSERSFEIDGESVYYGRQSFYPGLANLGGHPATAFPAGFTASGLPIGLQAIGPYLEDRTSLRFTACLAKEFGGFVPPPGYDSAF
jgi:amidase